MSDSTLEGDVFADTFGIVQGNPPTTSQRGKDWGTTYGLDHKDMSLHPGLGVGRNAAPQLITAGLERREGPLRNPAGSELDLLDSVIEGRIPDGTRQIAWRGAPDSHSNDLATLHINLVGPHSTAELWYRKIVRDATRVVEDEPVELIRLQLQLARSNRKLTTFRTKLHDHLDRFLFNELSGLCASQPDHRGIRRHDCDD